MGRSVSVPYGAELVAYIDADWIEDEFDWSDFKDDLKHKAQSLWPSLSDCDKWLDREDHAVLENELAYFGLSEYCGLVSFWVVPKDDWNDYPALAANWIDRIANRFHTNFGSLRKVGTFSNGETVYERV